MANRRMGSGNFDGFTRRPQGGGNFGGGGGGGQQNYGSGQNYGGGQQQNQRFEDSYSRRKDDYFDGRGQQQQGNFASGGSGGGGGDYGRNNFQNQPQRVQRDGNQFQGGQGGNWSQRSPSPRGGSGGGRGDTWVSGRSQGGGGYDDSRNLNQGGGMRGSNQGMGQGSDQQQQVVMVVPQGNSGAGGIMGMVPVQANNPFNVMQRQQPMQVIIPAAFNSDAFGQQILAATSARGPNFGPGMMGNGPQGGIMNQNQQNAPRQQQRYDRSVTEGGRGRFSRQTNGNQHRSPRATAIRRTELSTSGSNKAVTQVARSGRGVGNNNASANLRGNRKRPVVRGGGDDVERKKARPNLPGKARLDRVKKATNQRNKKKAENKKKEVEKKAEEAKKEGDNAEVKKEGEEGTEGGEDVKKTSKYDEFPTTLFVCKICQKVMNDGPSFESHLSGRAHLALVKILEKRFQKRTELLMFESKLAEEELGIEKDRQRRAGKAGHGGKNAKNHCKMCDCHYTVSWGNHKVSLGHRILKEYLHPACRFCNSNFLRRMDWVNHLFSVEHLRKLTELKSQGQDVDAQETALQDELFVVNIEVGKDEHVNNVINIRNNYNLPATEELKQLLKDELTLPQEIEIPSEYVENQAYGENSISLVDGASCKVCGIYIADRSVVDAHVRGKPHYTNFVGYLKKIVKLREAQEQQRKKQEEEDRKKAEQEAKKQEEEKKKAEEAAAKAAQAEATKSEASETPMETDSKVVEESTKTDLQKKDEKTEGSVEKPSGDVEMKSSEGEKSVETPAIESTTEKAASPTKEVQSPAQKGSPAKPAGQGRGNKQANRGNRGGNRGRGGQGSPRGAATPSRGTNRGGGARNSPQGNWRGGRGNARGGSRGGYQR